MLVASSSKFITNLLALVVPSLKYARQAPCHVGIWPVQLVFSTEEQDALVVGREADGAEAALEAATREGLFVVGGGVADGDAGEFRFLDGCAHIVPLDDERSACRDNPHLLSRGGYLREVQRQRRAAHAAVGGIEHHCLYAVATERSAGGADSKGQ